MFCITSATGERTYGFCRRFLPTSPSDYNMPRFPVTLCLLSVHRFFPQLFKVSTVLRYEGCVMASDVPGLCLTCHLQLPVRRHL